MAPIDQPRMDALKSSIQKVVNTIDDIDVNGKQLPHVGAPNLGGPWPGRAQIAATIPTFFDKDTHPDTAFDELPHALDIEHIDALTGCRSLMFGLYQLQSAICYGQTALFINYVEPSPSQAQKEKGRRVNAAIEAVLEEIHSLRRDVYEIYMIYADS